MLGEEIFEVYSYIPIFKKQQHIDTWIIHNCFILSFEAADIFLRAILVKT